jgi:hypothetical protein
MDEDLFGRLVTKRDGRQPQKIGSEKDKDRLDSTIRKYADPMSTSQP